MDADLYHVRDEARRVAALESLRLLETGPEERFDRITRAAAKIFGVPLAAVNLLDDRHLYAKSPQVPGGMWDRADTFCDVTIARDELTVVPDTTADPSFAWKPDVAEGLGVRFYAGRPLHVDGQAIGTLCLFDTKTRELSPLALQRLDELGAWAERELLDSRDLEEASAVQQALLPSRNPAAPAWAIAGLNLPFKSVGGDFYMWQRIGDSLELTVADVMGKGVASALMAASIRSSILSVRAASPSSRLEEAVEALLPDFDATGIFATAFHARLDLVTGNLAYSDAGHGLTLIVRADGTHEQLQGVGLPLGLDLGLMREDHETLLAPGETLVSFTDGLLDLYGGNQAALESIAEVICREREPDSVIAAVRSVAAGGSPEDDISVIALHRTQQLP